MKRFEFKVALHILIIFLLSIGSCLLYQRQLWFSTTVCILFLIGAGMHLYRIQFKQITLLRRLTDGLRYNDMTQNLHPPFKNKMMDEWGNIPLVTDYADKELPSCQPRQAVFDWLITEVTAIADICPTTGYSKFTPVSYTHLTLPTT